MIEIEVQNETRQTQERLRFAVVPRIGEGLRLREPDGLWASYDVLDVWYQKADYGDLWLPYLHVKMTPGEDGGDDRGGFDAVPQPPLPPHNEATNPEKSRKPSFEDRFASLIRLNKESEPFTNS